MKNLPIEDRGRILDNTNDTELSFFLLLVAGNLGFKGKKYMYFNQNVGSNSLKLSSLSVHYPLYLQEMIYHRKLVFFTMETSMSSKYTNHYNTPLRKRHFVSLFPEILRLVPKCEISSLR